MPRDPERSRDLIPSSIRAARAAADLTSAELAEAVGVARQTVSSWETGASVPAADVWLKVLDVCGLPEPTVTLR